MWNEDLSTSPEEDEDTAENDGLFVIILIKLFPTFAASLKKTNRCQVVLEPMSPSYPLYLLQDVRSSNLSQVRFQAFFTGQSPAQTVFPLQAKRIVINFHSYDVYLSCCLIFEPVPYLHHSTSPFLTS